jgi:hypothetical protein
MCQGNTRYETVTVAGKVLFTVLIKLDVDHHIMKKRLDENGNPLQEAPPERHTELGEDKTKAKEFIETVAGRDKDEKKEPGKEECGSCYGAETEKLRCCNTCEDVREAYRQKGWAFNNAMEIAQCKEEGWSDKLKSQQKEGCIVFGYLEVNKVAGNFHFAPGKSFQQHHVHVHDLQPFGMKSFNLTHTIHRLSFGQNYPGIDNPLDGVTQVDAGGSTMFQYFVKVVPTVYKKLNGKIINTNQYSATKHQKSIGITMPATQQGLPGVFVLYDLSPMMVQITETRRLPLKQQYHKSQSFHYCSFGRSFMHFLTGVCAIVGGVFTGQFILAS